MPSDSARSRRSRFQSRYRQLRAANTGSCGDRRAHGSRDGSDGCGECGGLDDLRHGQGNRSRDGNRRSPAGRKKRRPPGRLYSRRRAVMAIAVSEPLARATLKRGREGPVRGGNPWIFSQAIERIDPPSPEAGDLVTVHDASGALIGLGYFNPATTIAIRMLAWGETPAIDELVARRLKSALELRRRFIRDDTNAYRLVNGDGDGLSGVVVDRFGDVVVLQILTAGADRMRDTIVAALNEMLHPRSIIERSHGAVRKQEGLDDRTAVLAGESVTETITVENGIKLKIDFEHGQKK